MASIICQLQSICLCRTASSVAGSKPPYWKAGSEFGHDRSAVGIRSDGAGSRRGRASREAAIHRIRPYLTRCEEGERRLRELLHISRLSTVGEMASALAHELNQPLSAIANYLQGSKRLLQNNTDERAPKVMEAMGKAAEQAVRAGQVIQRLRDFVSRGPPNLDTDSS